MGFIDPEIGTTNSGRYFVMTIYAIVLLIFGLFQSSIEDILKGLYRIIVEPDFLITDYIGVGGIGAAFVNSGLLTLISIFVLYWFNINITGSAISTVWLISGFSFFGKNIFNVWFIIIGVVLYAVYQKDKINKYIYIGLLGTCLAPMVTQIIFGMKGPKIISMPLGIVIGIGAGFILSPLSAYLMRMHQGFNLYNIGFTAGILGTVIVSLFKSYGFLIESRIIWSSGNNRTLSLFLFLMFASMMAIGLILDKGSIMKLKRIYSYPGRLVTDFVLLEGFSVTLVNMGVNGILGVLYIIIIGGDLNGPTIGGIFTIAGFSSFGKHAKNMLPIFIGVYLGSITKIWNINDPSIQLAALFGTTLAPLAGEFGWKIGILAGFLHSSVVLNVSDLHAGFNLYNNGFAGGIVAAVLVPIIEAFRKDETK